MDQLAGQVEGVLDLARLVRPDDAADGRARRRSGPRGGTGRPPRGWPGGSARGIFRASIRPPLGVPGAIDDAERPAPEHLEQLELPQPPPAPSEATGSTPAASARSAGRLLAVRRASPTSAPPAPARTRGTGSRYSSPARSGSPQPPELGLGRDQLPDVGPVLLQLRVARQVLLDPHRLAAAEAELQLGVDQLDQDRPAWSSAAPGR